MADRVEFHLRRVLSDGTEGPIEVLPVAASPTGLHLSRRSLLGTGLSLPAVLALLGGCGRTEDLDDSQGGGTDLGGGVAPGTERAHQGAVRVLVEAPGEGLLLSGGDDGCLKTWRTADATLSRACLAPQELATVDLVAVSDDGTTLVAADSRADLRVYRLPAGTSLRTLRHVGERVRALAVAADGTRLALMDESGNVGVLDLPAGREFRWMPARAPGLSWAPGLGSEGCVALGPGGALLAAAMGGRVALWDAKEGVLLATRPAPAGGAAPIAFGGDALWTAGRDGLLVRWRTPALEETERRTPLPEAVREPPPLVLDVSADAAGGVRALFPRGVQTWDGRASQFRPLPLDEPARAGRFLGASGGLVVETEARLARVSARGTLDGEPFALAPGARLLAASVAAGVVAVRETNVELGLRRLEGFAPSGVLLRRRARLRTASPPAGGVVALTSSEGSQGGRELSVLETWLPGSLARTAGPVNVGGGETSLVALEGGGFLAPLPAPSDAGLWSADLRPVPGSPGPLRRAAPCGPGRVALIDEADPKRVRVVDWASRRTLFTHDAGCEIAALAGAPFSRGGRLAALVADVRVVVWDTDRGERVGTADDAVAWSDARLDLDPAGLRVAYTSSEHRIRVRDLDPQGRAWLLPASRARATAVRFLSRGTVLALGTDDGRIVLWALEDGGRAVAAVDPALRDGDLHVVTTRDEATGGTRTWTQPCGSPIPAGAVCTCNCVPGAAGPVRPYSAPSSGGRGGRTFCTCNKVCTCIPVCHAHRLLRADPIVRRLAETLLLDVGVRALPYLAWAASRARGRLRGAIDALREDVRAGREADERRRPDPAACARRLRADDPVVAIMAAQALRNADASRAFALTKEDAAAVRRLLADAATRPWTARRGEVRARARA
jgi:WD40 repeat protein